MFFKTEDGTLLHGRMAGCGRDLIIWSPGARSNISEAEVWCEKFEDNYGYTTFAYELRGHGNSKGSIIDFKNMIYDIQIAINVAIKKMEERGKGPDRVILVGHSLGSVASLTYGIQDSRVDLVFGLSTIFSIEDLLTETTQKDRDKPIGKKIIEMFKTPLSGPKGFKLFLNLVARNKVNIMPKNFLTKELMKKVYLIHGTKDGYVPFEKSGKLIIEKYNLKKNRYFLVDTGHSFENHINEVIEWIHSKL